MIQNNFSWIMQINASQSCMFQVYEHDWKNELHNWKIVFHNWKINLHKWKINLHKWDVRLHKCWFAKVHNNNNNNNKVYWQNQIKIQHGKQTHKFQVGYKSNNVKPLGSLRAIWTIYIYIYTFRWKGIFALFLRKQKHSYSLLW